MATLPTFFLIIIKNIKKYIIYKRVWQKNPGKVAIRAFLVKKEVIIDEMLDFLRVTTKTPKKGVVEIYPKFLVKKSSDLMIRGGDFYAIWDQENNLWSTEEDVAIYLIDKEVDEYANQFKASADASSFNIIKVLHLWDSDSGMIDRWHKYVQKHLRDHYRNLDEKIIFGNTEVTKKDYASKRLPYPLEEGDISAYEELISTLYHPPERKKIEWAIGSIVAGDSKRIQKFIVMYGAPGTGKSTILNIIEAMFKDYTKVFNARALGSSSNSFQLESLKDNPLIAIQHEGDLSKIEDNTVLNSVVSHEPMVVNEKFKSAYTNTFNTFLILGTNKPVRITDAKSGIIRRLIDVSPSGDLIPQNRYDELMARIHFEFGAIAYHCYNVYKKDPRAYDSYVPTNMLGASNDFYNFVLDSYDVFKREDETTLGTSWTMYNRYCDYAKVPFPYSQRVFKEELKNYFKEFKERGITSNGERVRNYYKGFMADKFEYVSVSQNEEDLERKISLRNMSVSKFDEICHDCLAQYATERETPLHKWDEVTSTLSDIDTRQLHYVRLPENHIVIDFDLKDEDGYKSLEKNLEAASKWPPTYAEISKGGHGIHLHYIYTGDPKKLSRVYDENIEVKVFTGKSSLRRKLTKCNNLPIASISSGLPLKGEKRSMVNQEVVKSERSLRTLIARNLNKEIHGSTAPSVSFIKQILDDAYSSGLVYDVSDMKPAVLAFAASSTNQSQKCLKMVSEMKFISEAIMDNKEDYGEDELIFYDVEIFPNLFVIVWKAAGKGKEPVKMINPTPAEVENLLRFRLVGFNCRRYDNHILYAALMGYSNEQLFNLSQKIISGNRGAFFREAYNLSYTDIYDFSSKKQSLKKFEIELGIHHQELGMRWDEPVPEDKWDLVADYCVNDVMATEATFNARKEDFIAREILAELSGLTVNDTTRSHTTKIIFGDERHPELVYTDLSKMFPGYKYENGHSSYMGEDPGEGGYVYSEPGMYGDVALLDIASMHPTSIIQLNLFGQYTGTFKEILEARLAIKHKDFDNAKKYLHGVLEKYLTNEQQADALAQALKIVINSVYGYTTATFDNPFRDSRNVDNIVAKRGALFMINLRHEVQKRGFVVAHIKTDSIKIPDATPEIIQFVVDYGKSYGYNFEYEATYEKMCLVNDAVYIAKYSDGDHKFKLSTGEKIETPWVATGTQFQVPYVFKTLFAKKPIKFEDMCETKSVTTSLYLDFNEDLPMDEHNYMFVGRVGRFCPIKPGYGGGILLREKDGKYYAATGSKGYRWMESEIVKSLNKEKDIDRDYYNAMVDDAIASISEYGDFEWFASDAPYDRNIGIVWLQNKMNKPE